MQRELCTKKTDKQNLLKERKVWYNRCLYQGHEKSFIANVVEMATDRKTGFWANQYVNETRIKRLSLTILFIKAGLFINVFFNELMNIVER